MPDEVFTQLVDTHYAALYRFALSLARSSSDASDLTQQTFYIWATKGSALRDLSKAKTWLFTTLYREFLRTRRRGQRLTALEDLPPGEKDVADELTSDQMEKLDGDTVLSAMQEIDEVFRAPLTLFYLQDLSYAQIAETLDVPIGTVMSRLSRGKTQLRARLAEQGGVAQIIAFPSGRQKTS
ncbi:MAG: RNA polymerase sigma factor [Verrucomicrobiota bacterium]